MCVDLYTPKRHKMQFLKTQDGSFSLYNDTYRDFYHSTKDGAILETLYKHIIPTFGLVRENLDSAPDFATDSVPIKVLDICFGLGYNALFTLAFANRLNIAVSIHSVELHLLEILRDFRYPKILSHYLPVREILDTLFSRGAWECGNLYISLHKGDARDYLAHLVRQNYAFDIIYQDAFSPSKNAELWDKSHFQKLYALLKDNGAISTYSSAKKVREICQNIGFEVYNMQCGNLKNGTILRKNSVIAPINGIALQKIML